MSSHLPLCRPHAMDLLWHGWGIKCVAVYFATIYFGMYICHPHSPPSLMQCGTLGGQPWHWHWVQCAQPFFFPNPHILFLLRCRPIWPIRCTTMLGQSSMTLSFSKRYSYSTTNFHKFRNTSAPQLNLICFYHTYSPMCTSWWGAHSLTQINHVPPPQSP